MDTKNQVNFAGKEIIIQYNTTLATNGKFYTDANGRQLMERQRSAFLFNLMN